MDLDYDEEVLRHPVCAPVWMKPSSDFAKRHGREWKGEFGLLNSSLLEAEITMAAEIEKESLIEQPSDSVNLTDEPSALASMDAPHASAAHTAKRRSTGNGEEDVHASVRSTFSMRHLPLPAGSSAHGRVGLTADQRKPSSQADDPSLTFPPLKDLANPSVLDDSPRISINRVPTLQQHLEIQLESSRKVGERIGNRLSSVRLITTSCNP